MRLATLMGLACLIVVVGASAPVLAQSSDQPSTDLQLELKRKQFVVPPPADKDAAAHDADAAARRLEEERRVDELSKKAMQPPPPPLDESVVEGIRSKKLQEQR